MRGKKVSVILCIVSVVCMILFPVTLGAREDISIKIITPSTKERNIAKGRSFYIMGEFENVTQVGENSYMKVSLFDQQKKPVRVIESFPKKDIQLKVKEGLPLFYSGVNKEMVEKSGMPDLVWDGKNESSFLNGNRKCYFDENGFNALVYVPNTNVVDELNFKDGIQEYTSLEEGVYEIKVELLNKSDVVVAFATMNIKIGKTDHKILSRFSPNEHFERVEMFSEEKGYRVYEDAFPGYWSKGDVFAEILSSWRAADIAEYEEGLVHFIIYNVKKSSTTYGVELALLQRKNAIDDQMRLENYYYEYGEPTLLNNIKSEIVAFDKGDKLELTRAELSNHEATDNVYDKQKIGNDVIYDLNVEDGVNVRKEKTLSLYGVCAPIQLAANDIKEAGKNAYQLENKLASVHYTITGDGVDFAFDKEVILNRKDGDWDNFSEMEFKHDIEIQKEMKNKELNVSLVGYDVHGNKIEGSEESFVLDTSTIKKSGVETGDNSYFIVYFVFMIISGTIIYKRIRTKA